MKITLLVVSCLLILATDLTASTKGKAKGHRHVKATTKSSVQGTKEVSPETEALPTGIQTQLPETGAQPIQTQLTETGAEPTNIEEQPAEIEPTENEVQPMKPAQPSILSRKEDTRYSVYRFVHGVYRNVANHLLDYKGKFAFIMIAPTKTMKYYYSNSEVDSALSGIKSLSEAITNRVFPENAKSNLVIAGTQGTSKFTAENMVTAQFPMMHDSWERECPYLVLLASNTELCYEDCGTKSFNALRLSSYTKCKETKWIVYVLQSGQEDYESRATIAWEEKYGIWPFIEFDFGQQPLLIKGGNQKEQKQMPSFQTSHESPDTSIDTSVQTPVDTSVQTPVDTSVQTPAVTSPATDINTPVEAPIDTGIGTPQHHHHHHHHRHHIVVK